MNLSTHPIGIDYTAAIHQTAGIGRYVRELVRALADLRPEADVRLFVAAARCADLPPYSGRFRYRCSSLSERSHARLWHRLRLRVPVEVWTGRVRLYHATDFTLPPTLPGARTILTIHDLAFERHPEETMPGMLGFLRRAVPDSIRRADHVIAVSEATRADLIDLYGTPPGKISVVPHGVSLRFHPRRDPHQEARVRQRYDLPDGPLVLTVGTHQPRKNHIRLVRAFGQMVGAAGQDSEPAPMLVIAGGLGWAYEDVMAEIAQLGLRQRVALVGFVDDADLPDLYRAAAVFAFPALYEGFGLPVLEAMACGVPVVTSNTSSLPEVTGPDAALLVDPHSEDSIAAALTRLLHDDALHAHLRQQGIARAAEFTWARAAESTWGIYEAALADQV